MSRTIFQMLDLSKFFQKFKNSGEHLQGMLQLILPEFPLSLVATDFIELLPQSVSGTEYVLVLLDVFTKYVELFANPKTVLTDKGTQFTSEVLLTGLAKIGIKPASISVRHSQSNLSKRFMRELARVLRILCHSKQQIWRNYLPAVEYLHNNVVHVSIGQMPSEVLKGTASRLPFHCLAYKPLDNYNQDRLIKVSEDRKRNYKLLRDIHGLRPSELVLVRVHIVSSQVELITKKLLTVFSGP
ncbi:hypothetical protein PR048_023809 [Dryococelus australis]|uniref:Integrase catalytic domain-containing protein n=1 Tax=Dryococelus australis TaxID=614101 RepID=A0ABQ9GV68_9NEOP|nr:hypothetical protein PR048_023809 [Dryococelus australis]